MKKKFTNISISTSMDPDHFLQAAQLLPVWNRLGNGLQFAREMDAFHTRKAAWMELKAAGAQIFTQDDTHLTASFYQMAGGMTNTCFRLQTRRGQFFLRVPGKGSEDHLSREDEAYNIQIAHQLGLNIEIFFFNPNSGLYVGEFLDNATPLTPHLLSEQQTMREVARIFKTLHSSPVLFKNNIEIFTRLNDLHRKINVLNHPLLHDAKQLKQRLKLLHRICQQDTSPLVPCHNDPTYLNFLYHRDQLKLLDYEYSGNNRAMFDLANFAVTSKLSKTSQQWLLQSYYEKSPTKSVWQVFTAYKQLTNLWWYLWAELQLANHSNVVSRKELTEVAHQNWHTVMGSTIGAAPNLRIKTGIA